MTLPLLPQVFILEPPARRLAFSEFVDACVESCGECVAVQQVRQHSTCASSFRTPD